MTLKNKLKKNHLTLGSWITIGDPSVAEIMAGAGFDWLSIDMEHSAITLDQAQTLISIIELKGVTPLVRVVENNANIIKRVMDAGAHGVIVPMVNTKEDAQRAVAAVKYPPIGNRGVGLARAQKYSLDFESYKKWNQSQSVVIVQIEHCKAVENLKKIMSVPGVDGFIIGPYDLSGSLGCPGEFSNRRLVNSLKNIEKKSKKYGYQMGIHVVDPQPKVVLLRIKQGYKFIAVGTDFLFLGQHCQNCLGDIKKGIRK